MLKLASADKSTKLGHGCKGFGIIAGFTIGGATSIATVVLHDDPPFV